MHLSSRLDALATDVLRGWRTAAHARGIKQSKARKAVAHWMGNRLAIGFYAWHVSRWMKNVSRSTQPFSILNPHAKSC